MRQRTQLHIGEVAQLLGVTPKTIRHYQRIGLLDEPERTQAGYRLYNAQDILHLHRIKRLQSLGLSLKQIKALLGDSSNKRSLREVLQALDEELNMRIQALEEQRNKIRALLAEEEIEDINRLPIASPTLDFVKEHLGDYLAQMSAELRSIEVSAFAIFEGLNWSEKVQEQLKQIVQRFTLHVAEHPAEYRALLALAERLVALASTPEDDPEVEQLSQDFIRYFDTYPFLKDLVQQMPQIDNPFAQIASHMMMPAYSPAQLRIFQNIARAMGTDFALPSSLHERQ
jgi:DNA-binding transcriptional MerR regulator